VNLNVISLAQAEDMTMTKPQITRCSRDQEMCLEITGASADSSIFRPVWMLKKVNVKLVDRKINKEYLMESEKAAFDWELNRVVFYENTESGLNPYASIQLSKIRESSQFLIKRSKK
jgi:hypothetical protein